MLYVKQGTHVIDHHRFLEAGVVARDLWQWGMLYAGAHETDGDLPMVAVLSSAWGRGGKSNVTVAARLVEVGLWERTVSGFRICRWVEQGNQTKAELTSARAATRSRVKRHRNGVTNGGCNANVPTSTSTSSGSDLEISPEEVTGVRSVAPGDPPSWFATALDVIEMQTGERLAAGEAWLRYSGHRAGKRIEPTQADAQYWLTTVMVKEVKAAREEATRRGARDTARDEQFRRDKLGVAPKPQDSRKEFAEREDWQKTAGPPDPETAARMKKLMGGVGR